MSRFCQMANSIEVGLALTLSHASTGTLQLMNNPFQLNRLTFAGVKISLKIQINMQIPPGARKGVPKGTLDPEYTAYPAYTELPVALGKMGFVTYVID